MFSKSLGRVLAGVAFAAALGGVAWAKVDVNHATEAQLQALHGVGPTKAHAIVVERRAHGPYHTLNDLSARVPGLGATTVSGFGSDVSFGPAASTAPAPAVAKTTNAPVVHAAPTATKGAPAVVHPAATPVHPTASATPPATATTKAKAKSGAAHS